MRVGEIADVDVVADRGSVRSGVIGSEHIDDYPWIECGGDDPRDEVRFGVVILAQIAVRIRARGVEVAQRGPVHAVPPKARSAFSTNSFDSP